MAESSKKPNPTLQAKKSVDAALKSAKIVGKQAKVATNKLTTAAKHTPSYIKPSVDVAIKDASVAIKDLKRAGNYEFKNAKRLTKREAKKVVKLARENKTLLSIIVALVLFIIGKSVVDRFTR